MDKIETVNFHQVQLYTTTSTLHCCTVLSIDCVHIQMTPPIHRGVWSMALMCTHSDGSTHSSGCVVYGSHSDGSTHSSGCVVYGSNVYVYTHSDGSTHSSGCVVYGSNVYVHIQMAPPIHLGVWSMALIDIQMAPPIHLGVWSMAHIQMAPPIHLGVWSMALIDIQMAPPIHLGVWSMALHSDIAMYYVVGVLD